MRTKKRRLGERRRGKRGSLCRIVDDFPSISSKSYILQIMESCNSVYLIEGGKKICKIM